MTTNAVSVSTKETAMRTWTGATIVAMAMAGATLGCAQGPSATAAVISFTVSIGGQ